MMQRFPSVVLEATRDTISAPSTHPSGTSTPTIDLLSLNTQLSTLGFRPAHVTSALSALQSAAARLHSSTTATTDPLVLSLTILSPLEAAIEWLLLHLPEDDLPQRYRTSASSSDFVVGTSKQGGLVRGWLVDRLIKQAGFPRKAVDVALQTDVSESTALDTLGRRLCGWEGSDGGWGTTEVVDWTGDDIMNKERGMLREEEILAVEAVLGDRYRRPSDTELTVDIDSETTSDKLILHVLFDPSSPYPSSQHPTRPPAFFLESPTLPSYMRLYLHASLLRQFRDADRGDLRSILESGQGGAVLSMVEYLEMTLPEVIENPPDIGTVTDHLVPRVVDVPVKSPVAPRQVKKTRDGVKKRAVTQTDHDAAMTRQKTMRSDPKYAATMQERERLPAWAERGRITSVLESNRVLVVVGEVCVSVLKSLFDLTLMMFLSRLDVVKGAVDHEIASTFWLIIFSTQLPQFILDHEIANNKGGSTNIIVTQPRRVAAMGVAARVAQERLEDVDKSPGTVGYAIRGERRTGPNTRLLFCTTGVVLRKLGSGDTDLEGVSHVIVDEAHERGVDTDLLICLLRELLDRNKIVKVGDRGDW